MKKPRTVTGRVALHMYNAIQQTHPKINLGDFEYGLMLGAAQVTQQGLAPIDFDNSLGTDAFCAVFAVVSDRDRDRILVTPEWRRVVISARRLVPEQPTERGWIWRSSGEATRYQRAHLALSAY